MLAHSADHSTSVGKALSLLAGFSASRPELGLSEIARTAGLSKSTAYRLLTNLVGGGVLERRGTGYALGPWVRELMVMHEDPKVVSIRELATPFLQELFEASRQTVHLVVPDGSTIVYINKVYGPTSARVPTRVGDRLQMGCSALGKAILAFSDETTVHRAMRHLRPRTRYSIVVPSVLLDELAEIRARKVAYDREEAALGLTCVAAPLLDHAGRAIGAVSVSGPTSQFAPERFAELTRRAADGLSRVVGTSREGTSLATARGA